MFVLLSMIDSGSIKSKIIRKKNQTERMNEKSKEEPIQLSEEKPNPKIQKNHLKIQKPKNLNP